MKKIVIWICVSAILAMSLKSLIVSYEISNSVSDMLDETRRIASDFDYTVSETKEEIELLNRKLDILHSSAEDIKLKKEAEDSILREKYKFLLSYDYSYATSFYNDINNLYILDTTCKNVGVNPYLVAGIIKVESDFDISESSQYSSAAGLMQIIEPTGEFIWGSLLGKTDEYNHSKTYDVSQNILLGTTYLKYLLDRSDSIDEALQRYNGKELGEEYTRRVFSAIESVDSSLRTTEYV